MLSEGLILETVETKDDLDNDINDNINISTAEFRGDQPIEQVRATELT